LHIGVRFATKTVSVLIKLLLIMLRWLDTRKEILSNLWIM